MTQSHLLRPHHRLHRHCNRCSSPSIGLWVQRRQWEDVEVVAVLGRAVVKCRHKNCPASYPMTPSLAHMHQPLLSHKNYFSQ